MTNETMRKVWTCDGCSSWTDKPVTHDELVARTGDLAFGWIEVESDDPADPGMRLYCPDCE